MSKQHPSGVPIYFCSSTHLCHNPSSPDEDTPETQTNHFYASKKVQRKGYKSTLKVPILEAKLVGSSASTSYAAVRVNGLSMLKFMRRTCNNIRDRTAFSYIQFQYKMIITNYNPLLVYNLILCFVKNNMRWMSKKNIAKILNLNKYDKIYS